MKQASLSCRGVRQREIQRPREQAKRERAAKENEDEYTEEMLLLPPGILRETLCHGVISREDRRGIRAARR